MLVNHKKIYRCDICLKEEEWKNPLWYAITFWLGKHIEHEFHVCSRRCEDELRRLNRKQKLAIYKQNTYFHPHGK